MFVGPQPAAAAKAVAAPTWAFAACALWGVGDLKGMGLVRTAASQYVRRYQFCWRLRQDESRVGYVGNVPTDR